MDKTHSALTWAIVFVLIVLMLAPVFFGLGTTVLASFGIFPAIGTYKMTFEPWRALFANPGLSAALTTSLISTLVAFFLALPLALICAERLTHNQPKWLPAMLAAPHSAVAIGFAFLIAPSGWIIRFFAPVFSLDLPPMMTTSGDAYGITLGLGLALKEFPFLLVIAIGLVKTLPIRELQKTAASLGYDPRMTWVKLVIPQLLPLMRLPIFITFVYALTNVDMALILGPSSPPSLPILMARWFHDPDINQILVASAGAIFLLMLVALSGLLGLICERFLVYILIFQGTNGQRTGWIEKSVFAISRVASLLMIIGLLALFTNLIWSFAWRWSFPNILPERLSFQTWNKIFTRDLTILNNTILMAVIASFLSLVIAIIWLELAKLRRAELFFMIPLMIPQISFLFGFTTWLRYLNLPPFGAIVLAHLIFIFPYMIIVLSAPWRDIDPRLIKTAKSLGKSQVAILFWIKIPMQLGPILLAIAIGVAVSVAQYLPTLFASGGRIDTITTEAITLASGSDRRLTGAFAFLQSALPMIAFAIASLIPRVLFRNRRAMLGGA